MKKILTILTMALVLTITGALTVSAQQVRQLKVYLKGGIVEKLKVNANTPIRHSCTDLNGDKQEDYVTMVVTDVEGRERPYLISQVDSLVLPSGQRVVFQGNMQSQPRRTSFSGTFPGTVGSGNVTFYWTDNDHIRLDAGDESRAVVHLNDKTSADFVFEDADLDATSYLVYYPDKSVTIPTVQTQTGANNTEHIGRSGDCGTAVATINGNVNDNVNYSFTLQHKAAFFCFLPHIDYLPSVKIDKIQVSCNEAIAGTYQLSPAGLYNVTNASKKITLNLNGQQPKDFFVGHRAATEQDTCAAYMVIAPQSASRNFTVTYFLTDTLSRLTTTYQQTFSLQPVENTVYPVTCRIPDNIFQSIDLGFDHLWSSVNMGSMMPDEPGNYYAWGETAPKGEFTASNYTAAVDGELLDICGTEYDPVSQSSLGNSWQMPTANEMDELIDLCHWEWTEYNGTEGWLVTGTNNGNDDVAPQRIFLPMTGYKNGTVTQQPSQGYYWLGTREDAVSGNASALVLSRESKQKALMQGWQGMNIRPVKTIWREFNIPYNGTQYIDLRSHGPGYNIKVYDHAGPNGNYSNGADGYLVITCAEGYKLNITGGVDTEGGCDPLVVYDVTENGDVEFGRSGGKDASINATSKTNVVKLYFHSDGSNVRSGLNLTVTIQRMSTVYHVNVENVEGGTLSINHSTINAQQTSANPEDTITMTATPAPGYVLHHIEVKCNGKVLTLYEDDPRLFQSASSAARHYLMCDTVRVRDGNWWHDTSHFLMPYSDVTVTPVFTNSDEDLWLNMAGNGTTKVERKYLQRLIDNGMSKFRFYDYAGKNANYGNNVDGYMFVDAPVGYVMQIDASTNLEGADHLYIYDGCNNSYQCLMDPHGTGSTTTHNNAFFAHFHTDGSVVYSGYDCVVTLKPDEVVQFNIPHNTVVHLTEEHMTWLLNTKGLTTMKVYDSGGPDGNYGSGASGSLYFHLPQGYHMHVYGTSSTEGCDYLNVYDTDGVKVSVSNQNQTVDYTTTSNFLRLQLTSDGSVTYAGVDLTVDFVKDEE